MVQCLVAWGMVTTLLISDWCPIRFIPELQIPLIAFQINFTSGDLLCSSLSLSRIEKQQIIISGRVNFDLFTLCYTDNNNVRIA